MIKDEFPQNPSILSKEEYEQVARLVEGYVLWPRVTMVKGWWVRLPYVDDKEEFYSIDYLVTNSSYLIHKILLESLKEFFQTCHIPFIKHKNTLSFGFNSDPNLCAKINLIFIDTTHFHWSYRYLGYENLGDFIAPIIHHQGFHLTLDGLFLSTEESHLRERLLVTNTSWNKMLNLFGFNPSALIKGFNHEEELLDFVVNSEFFTPEAYENLIPTNEFDLDFYKEISTHPEKKKRSKAQTLKEVLKTFPDFYEHFKQSNVYDLTSAKARST